MSKLLCANSLWMWRRKCLPGHCSILLPQHVEIATCQTKVLVYFHVYDVLWILMHIFCLQLPQYFQLKCILAVCAFLKDNDLLAAKPKSRYSLNAVLLKANPTFCYYTNSLGSCSASEPLVHEIPSHWVCGWCCSQSHPWQEENEESWMLVISRWKWMEQANFLPFNWAQKHKPQIYKL